MVDQARARRSGAVQMVTLDLDAATTAQIAILRLRDGLSMAEYQRRAAEAYALMMPGYLAEARTTSDQPGE